MPPQSLFSRYRILRLFIHTSRLNVLIIYQKICIFAKFLIFIKNRFMGKNKLQKFDDMNSFSHVFQFPFSTLREKGFEMKGKWNSDFFKNNNPIVLELGCGKGEYAVGLARKYPEKNFIGVDIKGARMWTGAKDALENGIANVAFLRTNIELITEFFAENEISEIWITFPDPQMKKVRKRLTSTRFMDLSLFRYYKNRLLYVPIVRCV